ncbi:FimV family protein [Dechloromonas sp. A34]|uniref:type IV pilus assembly protein FimV n=1 Tax=Dechloromonas sp. A34 TaxID=447588 RepID=UPI0022489520|nr:hypothetical protein [Dechloromonas sp. A34]
MNTKLFRLNALGLALVSSYAGAVGFGEIVLHSRVGEALRAEVPLLAGAGESIDTACFSLAPLPGSELPAVSNARIRLVRNGTAYRLLISGTRPVAEPIFVIGLRANCGVDLQRDYVLMPAAPVMLASADGEAPPPITSTASRKSVNFREWQAHDGDTLAGIAESQAPEGGSEQRRLLLAMKRANPAISADEPLTEGTLVRIPYLRQRTAVERSAPPSSSAPQPLRAQREQAPPLRPKKAPKTEAAPNQTKKGGDRLVLGKPPEDLQPGEKAVPPRASLNEMEERMLKLETTLQVLNQEIDKLNSALALTTEALAIQNKIQAAQSAPPVPDAMPAVKAGVTAPPPVDRSSQNNWLELLFSALAGGGIAAGMAHLLSRHRQRRSDDELPLAVSGYRPEVVVRPPASSVFESPATSTSQPTETLPAPTATTVDIPLEAETVDVNYNEGGTALELAEIMLSFGRVRGAAETLAQHIEENSPENIQPWSMLLDLYRRGDMPSEFETLAGRMREKFNVHVPSWAESNSPVSGLKSLEDYAHIVWRASNSWGTQECLNYLYELVHDNRAGQRSGFPLEVVEEIALLMRILEEAYGLKRPN